MIFRAAEEALRDTIAFVPAEYDNYVFLSNLYNIGGDVLDTSYYDKAVEVALDGVAVEPYGPAVRVQLARALIAQGRFRAAEMHLAYALKMDPRITQAVVPLAKVYVIQGRTDEALELLQRYPDSAEAVAEAEKIRAEAASATTQP